MIATTDTFTQNRGFRGPHEFYPTPASAVRALLSVERFDGSVWEPACGDGAISEVLTSTGHDVVSTDLVDHGYGKSGVDFLNQKQPRARHIITNPPYGRGLGDRFVGRALSITAKTGGKVAMLLNVNSLCHPGRHAKFVNEPPATIYALDDCTCWPCGKPELATRSIVQQRYCWAVWKPSHTGKPTFWWLSTRDFR